MILSKAGRLSLLAGLLCLLLMGFTGAANAVIRWDVFPSPTEVINSGLSEVLGSVTLVVQQNQTAVTGNAQGGPTQIAVLYNSKMMIDNVYDDPSIARWSGIRLYTTNAALNSALCYTACDGNDFFLTVSNIDVTGLGDFAGQVTIHIPGNIPMTAGEVIRVDGVRGRIAKSLLSSPNTDGFAQLQSINDPAGNQFFPETIRIAKSFIPLIVETKPASATLCLPSYGRSGGSIIGDEDHYILVKENFERAFVAKDSGAAGADATDRVDSYPLASGLTKLLGNPSNGTMIRIALSGIPASVVDVEWQSEVFATNSSGSFRLTPSSGGTASFGYTKVNNGAPPTGTAFAIYEYFTSDQTGSSDIHQESFFFAPELEISATNQQDAGTVLAAVSLWPPPATGEPTSGLYDPYPRNSHPLITNGNKVPSLGPSMPRFVTNYLGNTSYEIFGPCVCYMLYPYVTKDSFWNTGLVVANTSDDSGAIAASLGASRQAGPVTFWLYDYRLGNLVPGGVYFLDPLHAAPPNNSGPAFNTNVTPPQPIYYAGQSARGLLTQLFQNADGSPNAAQQALTAKGFSDFAGYLIAKANFQYCHGYAFVADFTFTNIAQGYVANVIPDPAVKGKRSATAAADVFYLVPAGESINN